MDNELIKRYYLKNIKTDYFVSTKGDVYSIKKDIFYKMKDTKSTSGYRKVRLCINGQIINRHIHRMVAETFIPNPDNKPFVNHKDGNKSNNKIENLEWVTPKENSIHAYQNNLMGGKNENFPTSTITNDKCREICELLSTTDMSYVEIAEKTGVSKSIVYKIVKRLSWVDISKDYDFSNRHTLSRIDEHTAVVICTLLEKGLSSKDIANKLKCNVHHVKDIKR